MNKQMFAGQMIQPSNPELQIYIKENGSIFLSGPVTRQWASNFNG